MFVSSPSPHASESLAYRGHRGHKRLCDDGTGSTPGEDFNLPRCVDDDVLRYILISFDVGNHRVDLRAVQVKCCHDRTVWPELMFFHQLLVVDRLPDIIARRVRQIPNSRVKIQHVCWITRTEQKATDHRLKPQTA